MQARILNIAVDTYKCEIIDKGDIIDATVRGNIKKKNYLLVGDIVELELISNKYVITKLCKRKNEMIRPPVANIDMLIIVTSLNNPLTDFNLLDKQLVLCTEKNIQPLICINKMDLSENDEVAKKNLEYILNVYEKFGIDIVFTSALNNIGIDKLKAKMYGKICALSGNSGVGKSSITKAITKDNTEEIEIGKIGKKTSRGKHTTKYVKLYNLGNNTYILDTPGFSSYELIGMSYKKLKEYYPEFRSFKCEFDDCMHVRESEDVCNIKKEVIRGNIDSGRYNRYVNMYNNLKKLEDRKYK